MSSTATPPPSDSAASSSPPDRNALIEANTTLVHGVVSKLLRQFNLRVDREELVQLGMLGLVEAADRWDPEGGASFAGFAFFRVQGAVLDGLGKVTGVTRSQLRLARRVARSMSYQESLADEATPNPRPEEAAEWVTRALGGVTFVAEFSELLESTAAEDVSDTDMHAPADKRVQKAQQKKVLLEVLEALDEKSRWVLVEHYVNGRSLRELGDEIGVSRSWTCRMHTRALGLARDLLEERGLSVDAFFGATGRPGAR